MYWHAMPENWENLDYDVFLAERSQLIAFVEAGLLKPGDLLDPVDPEWVVDAVVNDDGQLVIDGINIFEPLDEATESLDVTNLSSEDFWARHSTSPSHVNPSAVSAVTSGRRDKNST